MGDGEVGGLGQGGERAKHKKGRKKLEILHHVELDTKRGGWVVGVGEMAR